MISLQARATIALPYLHLRREEVLAIAWEVFKRLEWDLLILNNYKITAHTTLLEDGYNEEVVVQLCEKDFTVTSKSLQHRFTDKG
ncbi:MAG: hypothetical protein NZ521_06135, partial [Flammeovirgaceae bacterium]|nr:hypothetical protein [Flammeovirgaceae bacterium]MDW8287811.1 hypothetical protein [Flammeovirgaceae bacterium]